MKANKLIPQVWILISLLFTIHTQAQYPDGQETGTTHYIVGYEYAFNQGEGITYIPITPVTDFNLLTDIDTNGLTHDVNLFHIRFKDDSGFWSSMLSHIFIRTPEANSGVDTKIVGYEYAFNDGEGQTYVPITPTIDYNLLADIDVSTLVHDVNVFHIRFKDDKGKWSSMLSHIFIRPPEADLGGDTKIVGYEYAFNDGEGQTYVPITPTIDYNLLADIDVSTLVHDVNVFHIRFKDDKGKWSSMLSHIFIKLPEVDLGVDTKIVGYEYAFNDGEGQTYVPITPTADYNILTDIDVSTLVHDVNVFHIRFKDDKGKWSSMLSHIFIKPPEADLGVDTKIIGYEYALNNESYEYTSITPTTDYNLLTDIDVSNLINPINTIKIRFKDDKGKWSSMLNYLFIKSPTTDILTDNKLTSYEYWFDNDVTTKRNINIDPNDTDILIASLDMTHIWRGEHKMQTQYKDTSGKYSLVMTDTIIKSSLPIAAFDVDNTDVCLGESISFTDAGSIDYDTFVYDFGDGETSNTNLNIEHTYTTVGIYDASLTVTDTNTGVDSVFVKTITVRDYPSNNVQITGEIPACYGNIITLTAEENGASYLWSTGATTQSIAVTESGNYYVEISHNTVPSCPVQSDTIEVSFYPEIDNTVTLQDYPLLLTANQENASYQWIDCTNGDIPITGATSISYEPTVNGDYAVQITQNSCTVTSDCTTVGTVSVADYAIKQLVQLYPNPVNESLYIDTNLSIDIQLFNSNGFLIKKIDNIEGINSYDVSNIASGLYFVRVNVLSGKWKGKSTVYKIIKN